MELGRSGNITIWDARTLKPVQHMDQPWARWGKSTNPRPIIYPNEGYPEVTRVAFSPDGKQLATTGPTKEVCLWNVQTGELQHELWITSRSTEELAYSPDGNLLAALHDSAPERYAIKLCDPRKGEIVASLTGHANIITHLAFSPDGRTLASAGEDGIRLWNIATRERIGFFDDVQASFTSLCFSGDGKTLVACDTADRLHLWRTAAL